MKSGVCNLVKFAVFGCETEFSDFPYLVPVLLSVSSPISITCSAFSQRIPTSPFGPESLSPSPDLGEVWNFPSCFPSPRAQRHSVKNNNEYIDEWCYINTGKEKERICSGMEFPSCFEDRKQWLVSVRSHSENWWLFSTHLNSNIHWNECEWTKFNSWNKVLKVGHASNPVL